MRRKWSKPAKRKRKSTERPRRMAKYWGAKVDSNHDEIRKDFRAAGWPWQDVHRVKGFCDGLVLSPKGHIYLIEVKRLEGKKTPKASTNAKPATKKAQAELSAVWPVHVITSAGEAKAWRDRVEE